MIAFVVLLFTVLVTQQSAMAQQELKVIQGNSAFSNRLYTEIAKKEKGNIFFSPISVHTVLSMAYQGSDGETSKAFSTGLNLENEEVAAVGYQSILKRLNSASNVTLNLANKVYLKTGYEMQPAFGKSVKENFFSEAEQLNFAENTKSAGVINAWVEDHTNKKIKELIQPADLNDDTRLVLVNAIYFKGDWKYKFPKTNTAKKPFWLNDNDKVDVDMMYIKKSFRYKFDQDLDAQVLELPYANEDLSMVIVLPNTKTGIGALEKKLETLDINNITQGMYSTEVEVYLPKFKVETKIELNEPLKRMGLENIFSNSANFSKMISGGESLTVSKVVQKAFIEVNEEGSEAAAATAVLVANFSAFVSTTPEPIVNVDHPFVYYLLEKNNALNVQETLFSGRITKP